MSRGKAKVEVRGADRVARTMKRAADDLEHMDKATEEYAELLARKAQGYAPRRTGALRNSIVVQGQQVLATVRYSVPVEFGSRRRGIAAARFMGRAMSSTEDDLERIYTDSAEDAANKIKGI